MKQMNEQIEQITKSWRDEFEAKLPELLEEAEAKLREDFVTVDLPELLEQAEEEITRKFIEIDLPVLLEQAEEKLREDFEEELQENLDKVDEETAAG